MNHFSRCLAVAALAVAPIMAGCGDNGGSPTDPGAVGKSSFRARTECGESVYLAALSPVLPVWEDSIETWQGDTALLNTAPAYTGQSTTDYLTALVPVLQQWEVAINTRLAAAVVDTVADFNPATSSRQAYLTGLSSLLASWKSDLEANRGSTFLPAAPVFQADTIAPEIVCLADTTISCAPDSFVFNYEVTAIDDCDPAPVVTCVPPSGSVFPAGETLVTCTAADSLGNESTCTFTVTVEAAEGGDIASARARPNVLWPPNHKFVDVRLDVDVEGGCVDGDDISWTVTRVSSNEAVNGNGDGNTSPDWIITDRGVKLRAERSGTGSGRIYTVYFEGDDGTEGSVRVRVPHNK